MASHQHSLAPVGLLLRLAPQGSHCCRARLGNEEVVPLLPLANDDIPGGESIEFQAVTQGVHHLPWSGKASSFGFRNCIYAYT